MKNSRERGRAREKDMGEGQQREKEVLGPTRDEVVVFVESK